MCQVSLGLKYVQMVAHDLKLTCNKVPLFARKPGNINTLRSAAETSSCASKPLLMRCKLIIPQRMCQDSLGLKEVQMGAHDFKHNGAFFARIPGNINTSRSAAPKLALLPASRYYCYVDWSYHNVCAKFH